MVDALLLGGNGHDTLSGSISQTVYALTFRRPKKGLRSAWQAGSPDAANLGWA